MRPVVFVLLLVVAGFAVDYYQQAKEQDLALQELSPTAYLETITTRYDAWRNPPELPQRGKLPQISR